MSTMFGPVFSRFGCKSDDFVGAFAPVTIAKQSLVQLAGWEPWQLGLVID